MSNLTSAEIRPRGSNSFYILLKEEQQCGPTKYRALLVDHKSKLEGSTIANLKGAFEQFCYSEAQQNQARIEYGIQKLGEIEAIGRGDVNIDMLRLGWLVGEAFQMERQLYIR